MDLCLISCNIRFDNPADGDNSWSHRRSFLRDVILSHSPDIIATQEGRIHQLQDLANLLRDYEIVDQHRAWIGERMYPSFFIKKNKFELIRSEDVWLSETPDIAGSRSFGSTFPRLMTSITVQPVNLNKKICLVNTHLDHMKEETRLGQTNVLCHEARRIWNQNDLLGILGDFNDGPESEVRKMIISQFDLQDSWKNFNQKEESSHHPFSGEIPNGNRIDWILLDKRVKVTKALLDKTTLNGKYPTDHYPMIAKIKL